VRWLPSGTLRREQVSPSGERGAPSLPRVLCFATAGHGSNDEARILALLEELQPELFPFDRARKPAMVKALLNAIRRTRPDIVVMEGTGIAGGLAVIAARRFLGVPYIVSSGDAVGPFLALRRPWIAPLTRRYERALARFSAGFVGWSPYHVGRAMTLGAPRACTAAGWSDLGRPTAGREAVRAQYGIPSDALVFGIVGSMNWTERVGYCYGAELVRAIERVRRDDVYVLAVGGGNGYERLKAMPGGRDPRVILPGPKPRAELADILAAIDVGSLPQSVDEVGGLRYTTKISEYMQARLPIVTGQIPLAYDFDPGWIWRLPGDAPWDSRYVAALAELMESLDRATLARAREAVPADDAIFDRARQRERVAAFVRETVGAVRR
jgi:hypothetical protein